MYSAVPTESPEVTGRPDGVSEEQWQSHVASGKAMVLLMRRATEDACGLETSSVYGAALALPQFARTSGWSLEYTAFAVRSVIFLGCNIVVQGFCLYMIGKEERINDKFGGQMHLCDFGADIEECPDAPGCYGPGGTMYTPARLYNWNMWANRKFVQESFAAMFPERVDELRWKVDPGEYGLESYWLRFTCVLIFVIGLWPDLTSSFNLMRLLWHLPTTNEPWISYESAKEEVEASYASEAGGRFASFSESRKSLTGSTLMRRASTFSRKEHDAVDMAKLKFKVAGMPMKWKIFNWFAIFIPKLYIWLLMADAGTVFLMETAGIEDLIVNAVALSFILSIDELICVALFSDTVKHMMDNLEQYSPEVTEEDAAEAQGISDDRSCYEFVQARREYHLFTPSLYANIFPSRLFGILSVTFFFLLKYYHEHCERQADGSWAAVDLHLPATYSMSFWTFMFSPVPGIFPIETVEHAAWRFEPNMNDTLDEPNFD